jgi:hypothetical protein
MAAMKKPQPPIVEEWPGNDAWDKGHRPYVWVPARVPRCLSHACRRTGRCVRPRLIEGRPPPRWPSCPLVTDEEWALWGKEVYLAIERRLWELDEAAMAARQDAERAARRRRG